MIIFKQKEKKFDQEEYDSIFFNIENNLRELGFGDVSVNKKMKDLNKLLYDILLKINKKQDKSFKLNENIALKYFETLNDDKMVNFERYFDQFYQFCFELPLENVLREALKFKY